VNGYEIFYRNEVQNDQSATAQAGCLYRPFVLEHVPAVRDKVNIAVQAFLYILYNKVKFPETECSSRRFAFPDANDQSAVIFFSDPSKPFPENITILPTVRPPK